MWTSKLCFLERISSDNRYDGNILFFIEFRLIFILLLLVNNSLSLLAVLLTTGMLREFLKFAFKCLQFIPV